MKATHARPMAEDAGRVPWRVVVRSVVFAAVLAPMSACGSNGSGSTTDPSTSASGGNGSEQPAGTGGSPDVPCNPGDVATCACPPPATGQYQCDATGHFGACHCRAPAGSLVCAGRQCMGGGECSADGSCPAFLGACFTNANFQTCDAACSAAGLTCAQSSCATDGTGYAGGYTWVSYSSSNPAACMSLGDFALVSMDQCVTPIWLSQKVPTDSSIRCCCR